MTLYHETLGSALNEAFDQAVKRGYTVLDTDQFYEAVSYETSRKYVFSLEKAGKQTKKILVVSIYRMSSGRYELTQHIG